MYNPTIGRWMQEDPIDFEGGSTNLYKTLNNGPVNALDPMGLKVSIKGKPVQVGDETYKTLMNDKRFVNNPVAKEILEGLISSGTDYKLNVIQDLAATMLLRMEIIKAAREFKGGFRGAGGLIGIEKSVCWDVDQKTGAKIKPGKKPSEAIDELFSAGNKLDCDCATAPPIIYLKALLEFYRSTQLRRISTRPLLG